MSVNIYNILVQRDTYTITPTIATEYEATILKEIHGAGNVTVGEICGEYNPPADEYQRLVRRYGSAVVMSAIGKEENLKRILNPRSARKAKVTEETPSE